MSKKGKEVFDWNLMPIVKCAHCHVSGTVVRDIVGYGVGKNTVDLHDDCWQDWMEGRKAPPHNER